jgi:hypothetical protein
MAKERQIMTDSKLFKQAENLFLPKTNIKTLFYNDKSTYRAIEQMGISFEDGYNNLISELNKLRHETIFIIEFLKESKNRKLKEIYKVSECNHFYSSSNNCTSSITEYCYDDRIQLKNVFKMIPILKAINKHFEHEKNHIYAHFD